MELLCNKLLLIKDEEKIINKENKILISSNIGMIEKYKFLLFLLPKATSLDNAIGSPIWPRLINKEKVGNRSIYNAVPSTPKFLVIIILINIPKTLVTNPPNKRITLDKINFLFIVNNMKKIKKYINTPNNMVLLSMKDICRNISVNNVNRT